jgi:hypothetical protein
LAIAITLLKGAMRPSERTHQFMTSQITGEIGSAKRAPTRIRAAANGGWMAENIPLRRSGEVFLLDIPFYRTRRPEFWHFSVR